LIQIIEEAFLSRDASRTNLVVGGLVQHIVASWREQFCKTVIMKFNCYFMLPFVDELHRYMRQEIQDIYGAGDNPAGPDVFDLSTARRALESHRDSLRAECDANKALQEKFKLCAKMMKDEEKYANTDNPRRYSSTFGEEAR
jgi:hypothetical protein